MYVCAYACTCGCVLVYVHVLLYLYIYTYIYISCSHLLPEACSASWTLSKQRSLSTPHGRTLYGPRIQVPTYSFRGLHVGWFKDLRIQGCAWLSWGLPLVPETMVLIWFYLPLRPKPLNPPTTEKKLTAFIPEGLLASAFLTYRRLRTTFAEP